MPKKKKRPKRPKAPKQPKSAAASNTKKHNAKASKPKRSAA